MIGRFKRYRPFRDRVSASDMNRRAKILESIASSQLSESAIGTASGILTRKGGTSSKVTVIRIFEVQSNATGDGVYNCYEQTLDEDRWADTAGADAFADKNSTSVEVLNLLEHHVHATYARNLIAGDRIAAWSMSDDEGNSRLVGVPIGPYREGKEMLAKVQSTPTGTTISVKICDQDGNEIGSSFNVAAKICNGSALNAATPRLASNDYIFVTCIAGTWYCTTIFQGTENCTCTAP